MLEHSIDAVAIHAGHFMAALCKLCRRITEFRTHASSISVTQRKRNTGLVEIMRETLANYFPA